LCSVQSAAALRKKDNGRFGSLAELKDDLLCGTQTPDRILARFRTARKRARYFGTAINERKTQATVSTGRIEETYRGPG